MSLYGGFAGNEASKDDRALEDVNDTKLYKNKTVLNANDDVADVWVRANEAGTTSRYTWEMESASGKQWVTGTKNNYTHVMYCGSEFKQKTVIDGFTLKGGNANVWNVKANGGAVYAIGDVHISHCRDARKTLLISPPNPTLTATATVVPFISTLRAKALSPNVISKPLIATQVMAMAWAAQFM
ncbi:MAG: hypothetical protein L6U16_10225 [Porphyromonadaceae bacterium]|nr:MAG: hypothetical protein L6U16_10225 [Porphyromonadaceae bacterium]